MSDQDSKNFNEILNKLTTKEIMNKLNDAEDSIIDAYHLAKDRTVKALLRLEMHHMETIMDIVENGP